VIDPNIAIKLTNSATAVQNIFISFSMLQFVKAFDFGCQAAQSLRLTDIVILVPVPISVDASFKSCWCLTDDVSDNPHAFGAFKDFVIFIHGNPPALAKIHQIGQERFACHPQARSTE
jgi:hypothetical protein